MPCDDLSMKDRAPYLHFGGVDKASPRSNVAPEEHVELLRTEVFERQRIGGHLVQLAIELTVQIFGR